MEKALKLPSRLVILLLLAGLGHGIENEPLNRKILLDRSGETILVLTLLKGTEGKEEIKTCQLLTDKSSIEEILRSTAYADIQQPTNEEMQDMIDACTEFSESISGFREQSQTAQNTGAAEPTNIPEAEGNNDSTEGYSGVPVILPGTKWCGAGDRAKAIQDLGYYEDTDQCCRAHDLCNDTLAPGETRNNLTNDSSFTKLNCRCDDEFYGCLEKINSVVSNTVGNLYFNVLLRGCYKYDYPDGECITYRSFLKVTCKEYGKNTAVPKIWQWVAPRMYKTLPIPGPLTVIVDLKK